MQSVWISVFHLITQHYELSTFVIPSYRCRTWTSEWVRNFSKPHSWYRALDLTSGIYCLRLSKGGDISQEDFICMPLFSRTLFFSERMNWTKKLIIMALNNIRNYDSESNFSLIKFTLSRLATTQEGEIKFLSDFMMSHHTPSDSMFRNTLEWVLHLLAYDVCKMIASFMVRD